MDAGPLRDALTLLAGLATGVLSAAFGVGGAVVSTPAVRALGLSASLAIGSTLPATIPSALAGALRYRREGLVHRDVVLATAPAGVVASVLGALVAPHVPGEGHALMLVTAGFLAFTAVRTWRRGDEVDPDEAVPPAPRTLALVGAAAGFLSGILGVGGGILMVPGFTQLGRLRLREAIATSLVCVGLFGISGTVTHGLAGGIDWRFALLLALGVVPGARLGAGIALRASEARLRVVVAVFLGLTSVVYAASELSAIIGP